MNGPTTSLVQVEVVKANAAAQAMLKHIDNERSMARLEYMEKLMKTRKFLFCKKFNLKEAEEIVDGQWPFMDWRWDYTKWKYRCETLEILANEIVSAVALSSDGKVWLNLHDANIVKKFLA